MRRRLAGLTALASIGAALMFAGMAQAHQGICTETTNPHGQTMPPAGSTTLPGPNGGQNEDGFYLISSNTGVDVFVKDLGSGTIFGPFPSGTKIKYTQAPGGTPSQQEDRKHQRSGRGGPVPYHRHRGRLRFPDRRAQPRRELPGPASSEVVPPRDSQTREGGPRTGPPSRSYSRSASRNASGWSRGGSSAQSSITRSGQP